MHKELEKLVSLHDLDVMISDLKHKPVQTQEKNLGFSPDIAVEKLEELRSELESEIEIRYRDMYNQLCRHYGNAVVPVIHGICSGCFTQLPTILSTASERNAEVNLCPTCGRFIYMAD